MAKPLPHLGFSHIAFRVRDIDTTVAFYREVLGWEPTFEVTLGGETIEQATGVESAVGRMVGGKLGGVGVEFAQVPGPEVSAADGLPMGFLSISVTVTDVDDLHRQVVDSGIRHEGPPHEVAGHRMLVLLDPDDVRVQLIQYPQDGDHQ